MYFLYSGETKRIPQGVKYFFYNAENGQSLIYAEEKKYKGPQTKKHGLHKARSE